MIKLPDGEIRDYLPVTVKNDIDMVCLSYAIKKATERLLEYQEHTMVYSFIESMPEQICDIMAADLRPPYYSDSMPLKVKREIIKNTLAWYMTAGTPAAIDGLLSTVFGWGKTEEWFEYGGRPYYFRLLISIDADQKEVNIFLKSLNLVKNARSWLDAMVYSGVIDHTDLENIILKNVLTRITIPFWGGFVFDGTWFFDGSMVFKNRRRYGLCLAITYSARIMPGINWKEKFTSLKHLLKTSITMKYNAGVINHYGIRTCGYCLVVMQRHVYKIKVTDKINLPRIYSRWGQHIKPDIKSRIVVSFPVFSLHIKYNAKISFRVQANQNETAGNFSAETKSKDYWLFDGSVKMDGNRKFNSIYRKETE